MGGVTVADFEGESQKTIVEALLDQWLSYYLTETDDPQWQLADYRIESVEIREIWQECAPLYGAEFIASVSYSVQPANDPPWHWAAGTGTLGEEHWILNKIYEVAVRQSNGFYEMTFLGVPVC